MLILDVCAPNDKWLNLHLMLFANRMPTLECGDVDTAYCGMMSYLVKFMDDKASQHMTDDPMVPIAGAEDLAVVRNDL